MRVDKNQQLQADTQGNYSFGTDFSGESFLNFPLGFADSYQRLQSVNTEYWLNNTYSAYGMDNWHILPRLTLNLGVRYDALPHVYEKNNRVSNFVPADFSAAQAQVPNSSGNRNPSGPGFNQPTGGILKNSYLTIQPRLGFALNLFGTGKSVLRGAGSRSEQNS